MFSGDGRTLQRNGQMLVEIPGDGISILETLNQGYLRFGPNGGTSQTSINMKPDIVLLGNFVNGVEGIDSPNNSSTNSGVDHEWVNSLILQIYNSLFKSIRAHSSLIISLNFMNTVGSHTHQGSSLSERIMRFSGGQKGNGTNGGHSFLLNLRVFVMTGQVNTIEVGVGSSWAKNTISLFPSDSSSQKVDERFLHQQENGGNFVSVHTAIESRCQKVTRHTIRIASGEELIVEFGMIGLYGVFQDVIYCGQNVSVSHGGVIDLEFDEVVQFFGSLEVDNSIFTLGGLIQVILNLGENFTQEFATMSGNANFVVVVDLGQVIQNVSIADACGSGNTFNGTGKLLGVIHIW
mmetsp:Transcript_6654/g.7421  ORF Transcript_6654/g.7421 Transcript_6654/m.7421 type:complete len:349 (+) Transcript_6654:216-1262(+)